jgi:hypothetical protein
MPKKPKYTLQYLDEAVLSRLARADRNLQTEREQERQRAALNGAPRFVIMSAAEFMAIEEPNTPIRKECRRAVNNLTTEQVAESVALIDIARGRARSRSLRSQTALWLSDLGARGYLQDKTGFGYLSAAMDKLGISLVQIH